MKNESTNTIKEMAVRDFLVLKIIGKSYLNAAMDYVAKKEKKEIGVDPGRLGRLHSRVRSILCEEYKKAD